MTAKRLIVGRRLRNERLEETLLPGVPWQVASSRHDERSDALNAVIGTGTGLAV